VYKEIEEGFKLALSLVKDLDGLLPDEPKISSKINFKKELTKLLTACKAKAKLVQ
jgi:hypothetical protein